MDLCIEETVVRGSHGCPSDQKASRLTVCRAGCCPSHLARIFKVMIPKLHNFPPHLHFIDRIGRCLDHCVGAVVTKPRPMKFSSNLEQ